MFDASGISLSEVSCVFDASGNSFLEVNFMSLMLRVLVCRRSAVCV